MPKIVRSIATILGNEKGTTAIEYGLIAALVVIAMILSLSQVANTNANIWDGVAQNMSSTQKRG